RRSSDLHDLRSFPTRRSSDLRWKSAKRWRTSDLSGSRDTISESGNSVPARSSRWLMERGVACMVLWIIACPYSYSLAAASRRFRSEEHTSELQSRENLVCRLL